jgi:hypothetical protein
MILGLAALLTALPVFSDASSEAEMQAAAPDDMAAMEEVWAQIRTPGENHEFLARLEGEWTFETTLWMDPSMPPMKSAGTATKTMILGGRFLQEEVSGSVMEQPFQGLAVTGFDNVTREFMGTWIDDMATTVMYSRGSRTGDELTLNSEMTDPMSGQPMELRMVTRVVDEDHHVFDYYVKMPGMAETKQMAIEYTRKGGE